MILQILPPDFYEAETNSVFLITAIAFILVTVGLIYKRSVMKRNIKKKLVQAKEKIQLKRYKEMMNNKVNFSFEEIISLQEWHTNFSLTK
ncbi:hypothetical protein [Polaribacter sp. IC073]|uniref:hypothetical protein n=1 Tax=Polaribacter sp. IC073 TaxID=2508540 RepID=UPI0011BE5B8B|nr:hypothetical protein [Polaribacter sp. IC073]TXD45876.1 hypothetical protein ES045_15745 [Polaribacter sp. IC073]